MASTADELADNITGSKKKKETKQDSWFSVKSKQLVEWVNYSALPFVCKLLLVVGFGYAVVNNLQRINTLPEIAQGAVATIIIAIVLKVAANKR